ncbi:MAG: hypothetical protein JWM80_3424 [Cyanobacteria bacterium RYN_339]|nr:hypothetical protein [Cyanobacteria bacterium RYN_339]
MLTACPRANVTGTIQARPASAGSIQAISAEAGQPLAFSTTQQGKTLTLVASAGGLATHLTAGLGGKPYALAAAPEGPAPAMPYHTRFAARPGPARKRLLAEPARVLGAAETFWVNTGDASNDVLQTAVLERITDHAFFYKDKQAKAISDAQFDALVAEFETKIYPREAAVFGTPPHPGVDNEERVFIVVSPAVDNFGKEKGLMGYFWSRDALPNGKGGEHSNRKEVLFMSDKLFDYPALTSFGTMAHEYQHLLNFSAKSVRSNFTVAEETWLDEGLAMYAMEVAGYGLPAGDPLIAKDLNEFLRNPLAYSLTDWENNPHHFSYGQNYLFVRYLADRYGADAIKDLYASDRTGVGAVEDSLKKRNDTFAQFFADWAVTNVVTGLPVAVGTKYRYQGLDLAGDFGGFRLPGLQTTRVIDGNASMVLRPWGCAYLTYVAGAEQAWSLALSSTEPAKLVGAAVLN